MDGAFRLLIKASVLRSANEWSGRNRHHLIHDSLFSRTAFRHGLNFSTGSRCRLFIRRDRGAPHNGNDGHGSAGQHDKQEDELEF